MSKRKWLDVNLTNGLPQRSIEESSSESNLTKTRSPRNRAFKEGFGTYMRPRLEILRLGMRLASMISYCTFFLQSEMPIGISHSFPMVNKVIVKGN